MERRDLEILLGKLQSNDPVHGAIHRAEAAYALNAAIVSDDISLEDFLAAKSLLTKNLHHPNPDVKKKSREALETYAQKKALADGRPLPLLPSIRWSRPAAPAFRGAYFRRLPQS